MMKKHTFNRLPNSTSINTDPEMVRDAISKVELLRKRVTGLMSLEVTKAESPGDEGAAPPVQNAGLISEQFDPLMV